MKLHEIRSADHPDPIVYELLQQRLARKEPVVFWAWDGSEQVNGLIRSMEKDDLDEPTAYLFHFKDLLSYRTSLDTMGFIADDLEGAELDKVDGEWHLSIPKPLKEGHEDPIAFDLIRQALQKGRTVVFRSVYAGRNKPVPFHGLTKSIGRDQRPGENVSYELVYHELLKNGEWADSSDITYVSSEELDGVVFDQRKDGGLHFFLPNHDQEVYKP